MLPTLTRHLQLQYQQIADASNPDQASANSIPANCRCFQPQDRHLQIHIQQIADTSDPDQASANPIPANCRYFHVRNSPLYVSTSPIPANCRYFRTQDRHLQIQFQQIADTSDPDQASTSPIPASCGYFRPRPGICKSKSNKLQMLPNLTRHLQIHIQQIVDASEPNQASANPNPASCGCFQPQPGICKSNSN